MNSKEIVLTPEQHQLVQECIEEKTFLRALPIAGQIIEEMHSYYVYHGYPIDLLFQTTAEKITRKSERSLLELLYRNYYCAIYPQKKTWFRNKVAKPNC